MTAVGKAQNFLPQEKIFSSARKFFFLRKEISLRVHGIFRPSEGSVFPSEGQSFFFPRAIHFLSDERKFSCLGKIFSKLGKRTFLPWKIPRLPHKKMAPSAGKNDAVRKAENFRAHRKKIPHMRKYFFVYAEINFLIYGNFLPYMRRFFALPTPGEEGERRAFSGGR